MGITKSPFESEQSRKILLESIGKEWLDTLVLLLGPCETFEYGSSNSIVATHITNDAVWRAVSCKPERESIEKSIEIINADIYDRKIRHFIRLDIPFDTFMLRLERNGISVRISVTTITEVLLTFEYYGW